MQGYTVLATRLVYIPDFVPSPRSRKTASNYPKCSHLHHGDKRQGAAFATLAMFTGTSGRAVGPSREVDTVNFSILIRLRVRGR
ncbi:hypothetical protein SCYAM73S_01596 [Streptomyces cyaneofuscatus]